MEENEEYEQKKREEKVQMMLKRMKERNDTRLMERKKREKEMKKIKIKVGKVFLDNSYIPRYDSNRPSLYFREQNLLVTGSGGKIIFWELVTYTKLKELEVHNIPVHGRGRGLRRRETLLKKWRNDFFFSADSTGEIICVSIESMNVVGNIKKRTTFPFNMCLVIRSPVRDRKDTFIAAKSSSYISSSEGACPVRFFQLSYSSKTKSIHVEDAHILKSVDSGKFESGKYRKYIRLLSKSSSFIDCFYTTLLEIKKEKPNNTYFRNQNPRYRISPIFYIALVDYKKDSIIKKFHHPDDGSTSKFILCYVNREGEEILISIAEKFIYLFQTTSCACFKKFLISQRSSYKSVFHAKKLSFLNNGNFVLVVQRKDDYKIKKQSIHFFKLMSHSLEPIWETNFFTKTEDKDYGKLSFVSYDENENLRFIASGSMKKIRIIRVVGFKRRVLEEKEMQEMDLEERIQFLFSSFILNDSHRSIENSGNNYRIMTRRFITLKLRNMEMHNVLKILLNLEK